MGQSKSKMLSPDAISVKKKGFLYYLKRDWQLYALLLLPMAFIIVFKYFAYTGLSVAFLDYKIGKGYGTIRRARQTMTAKQASAL